MHQYRIYTFREDGDFSTVRRIECTDQKQPSKRRSNLWKARTVSSGKVNPDRTIHRPPETTVRFAPAAGLITVADK